MQITITHVRVLSIMWFWSAPYCFENVRETFKPITKKNGNRGITFENCLKRVLSFLRLYRLLVLEMRPVFRTFDVSSLDQRICSPLSRLEI